MKIPWHTRARIHAVEKIADWLRVPVEVLKGSMPEVKLAEIDEYIGECEKLFGPVFESDQLFGFRQWINPFLKNPEMIDNPFNLNHHHLETAALYFGIGHVPGNDEENAKMETLWEKYNQSGLKLTWWEQNAEAHETLSD